MKPHLTLEKKLRKYSALHGKELNFHSVGLSLGYEHNMDAPDLDALRSRDYWEKRYNSEPAEHEFDWFKSYDDLAPWLNEILRFDHRILMLGCGNSVQTLSSIEESLADMVKGLSSELYKRGFKNIQNIDFSETVIHKMSSKYSNLPEMTWKVRPCRNSITCLYLIVGTD